MQKKHAFLCSTINKQFKIVYCKSAHVNLLQEFEAFVSKACSISEKIGLKRGIWRSLYSTSIEKKWLALVEEMKARKVDVRVPEKPAQESMNGRLPTNSTQESFIEIEGEREIVTAIKRKIIELVQSVKVERIGVVRPGVIQYFFSNPSGQAVLSGAEHEARVCIELEFTDAKSKASRNSLAADFTRVCFASTRKGQTFHIYVGDITQFNRAEVIVNAANEDLQHTGGVAKAIADCGGPVISSESDEYVKKKGKVSTGSAVIFSQVGNLPAPYRAIVHAVGPRWHSPADNANVMVQLRKTIRSSLKVARNYSSIAIPAISSGIYGVPSDMCATALVKGAVEYLDKDTECKLNDINFIILENNVKPFIKAVKAEFENVQIFSKESIADVGSFNSMSNLPLQSLRTRKKHSLKPAYSLSLQKVKIIKGDILDNQCEVLVHTTDEKLGFNGFVGRVLLEAAGQGLSDECKKIKTPIQCGEIVSTGAHNLMKSKHIVHVVLPRYSGTQSEQILRTVVKKILKECSRLKAKSVAIPSIGAGNLGYPKHIVAQCLLEETESYLTKKERKTSLQLVNFIIFEDDIHRSFQSHYSQFSNSKSESPTAFESQPMREESDIVSMNSVTRPLRNVFQQIDDDVCNFSLPNDLILQLVKGDITEEKVDAVVNTTNPEMQLNKGGVATALLRKGGARLQAACDALRAQGIKVVEGKVVQTRCEGMGKLKCKSIFHISFDGRDQRKLINSILACLDRAEKMKYNSISFPAIGTGANAYPPHMSADAIVKALKKFTIKNTNHLKVIRMVIFLPDIYGQFIEAFKRISEEKEGIVSYLIDKSAKFVSTVGSVFSSLGAGMYFDDDDPDDDTLPHTNTPEDTVMHDIVHNFSKFSKVDLCIYGDSENSVRRAEKRINGVIETIFTTEKVDNYIIAELPDSTIVKLNHFASKHDVDVDIDCDPSIHTIEIHGCQADVYKVKDKIRDLLIEVEKEKEKHEVAAVMQNHVKWVRQLSDDQEDYDEVLNLDIEKTFQRKEKQFKHVSSAEKFVIDFSKMQEIDLDTKEIVRVLRIEYSIEKPTTWVAMPKDMNGRELTVYLVKLNSNDSEYQTALSKFNVTMSTSGLVQAVVSIQRIQNPVLYGQYTSRKKEMEKRNPPGCQNERRLFHGTKGNVVDNINTQGFNRSFKNVTMYGQGVYFATDASYSHKYASPDANGNRHMYLTKVLTGEYVVGNQQMLVPPTKQNQQNNQILYDSTVDNQANPSIFVVYNDAQAYAEYLITYQ